jgi:hypothetical protein
VTTAPEGRAGKAERGRKRHLLSWFFSPPVVSGLSFRLWRGGFFGSVVFAGAGVLAVVEGPLAQ